MKFERIIWVVVILLIAGFFGFREWKHNQAEKGLQTMLEVLNDNVEVYKNKEGQWEAERKSFNLTTAELRKNGQELGFENSGLKKRVGNLKNLVNRLEGDLEAIGTGSAQLTPDTVYLSDGTTFIGHKFDWSNNYLSLNGTLSNTYELNFDYSYKSSFEVTTYWKRSGMFKRKDLVVNFTMSDPNAQATDLNSVVIKPDPPKFFETNWFWGGVGFLGGLFMSGLSN